MKVIIRIITMKYLVLVFKEVVRENMMKGHNFGIC